MIRNLVGDLLRANGQSIAELQRATGLTYANAHALATENVSRIEFRTLIKLCDFFRCQPGDLFKYDPEYIPGLDKMPWTAQAATKIVDQYTGSGQKQ